MNRPDTSPPEYDGRADSAGFPLEVQQAIATLQQLAGHENVASETASNPTLPRENDDNGSAASMLQSRLDLFETRYQTLVEQIPAITFMAALSSDDVELYVSPQIETMLGFTQAEWLGDPFLWYRQLHPEDRLRWQKEFARTCATGVHFKAEYRFLSRDNREVWVQGEASIVRDEDGRPLFLHGIAFDITESKRAEQVLLHARQQLEEQVSERTAELHASEQKLLRAHRRISAILESAVDAIVTIDDRGLIESANSATEHLFGYPVDELIGQNVKLLMPEPYRSEHDGYIRRYLNTGEAQIIGIGREVSGLRKDGTTFPMELAVSEVIEGEQRLFTGIIRDISERLEFVRALDEAKNAAERANRAKSEFLANMSHEIRTPMNAIMGMTELVMNSELTSQQREQLKIAAQSADSLLTIINEILDFSKIEAGKIDLESVTFSLRECLGTALKSLAQRAHDKNLELACHVAPGVPDSLVGDPARLGQVIVNLVGNAIKFTEVGEVVVDASIASQKNKHCCLRFAVSDTGIGIPPEKQSQVFDAFAQADASTTRLYGGTGLGLAITSRLVEKMGGELWLDSDVGRGSTFHFTAQLGLFDEASPQEAVTVAADLQSMHVLVVDDNATNRRILEEIFASWQLRTTIVASGPAALAALEQASQKGQAFSLVITDHQMPEMDGFTLAERIKENTEIPEIAIIMLNSGGYNERGRELGITHHLVKPVTQSELLAAILSAAGQVPVAGQSSGRGADVLPIGKQQPRRILLAEDNVLNQKVAVGFLEAAGHTVVVANNGREALAALERESFDLVLMDVQMPVMDGFEATKAILERETGSAEHIPVIAMTARAMQGDRERCLQAGMDAYVSKPVAPKTLFESIESVCIKDSAPHLSKFNDGEAVIDKERLLQNCGGDTEMLEGFVRIFFEECPAWMDAVREAVQRSDGPALERAAHSLKGGVSNFFAEPATKAARKLETMGREADLAGVEESLAELETEISRLGSALRELVVEQGEQTP